MADLTQIPADEAITIPATEAEVFDALYLKNMRFVSNSEGGMKVIGNMVPYCPTSKKTLDEPVTPIIIEDIFAAVEDEDRPIELRTLLGQTIEGILQSVVGELAYQKTIA